MMTTSSSSSLAGTRVIAVSGLRKCELISRLAALRALSCVIIAFTVMRPYSVCQCLDLDNMEVEEAKQQEHQT
jgi:hypothetical protein